MINNNQNNMMINPMAQMFDMFRQMSGGGQNPQAVMAQMFGNNPNYQRAMQMIQGKSPQELQQVAVNLAGQRGISREQMQQMMSQFGINL